MSNNGQYKKIEINHFRGIKKLEVSRFSNINLIVGDNNSGKTSFLEAIQLLFANVQLGSIKNIIKQRTVLNVNDSSFYSSFIKMFNAMQRSDSLELDIYAESNVGPIEFEMRGTEKSISGEDALQISTMSSRQKAYYKKTSTLVPEMVKVFNGSIISQKGKKLVEKKIKLTSLDNTFVGPVVKKEVQYIPSFGHLRYDLLQNIVDNPEYKNLAISILKQFDEAIVDICYTKADDGSFLETVITEDGVNMPFSVYGDGIKKILYILNKLFDATDSILLIDEIETGLHKKYYDKLFPVVFELAKKLNVQLFIATHSMEAMHDSNPSIFEWCASPVVYQSSDAFEELKRIRGDYYSRKKSLYHYWHMANGNYQTYLQGEKVRIKKYFYVIRPLLAAMWVVDKKTQSPMLFLELLDAELPVGLRNIVDELLEKKQKMPEMGMASKIKELDNFIDRQLIEVKKAADTEETIKRDWKLLNEFFDRVVGESIREYQA